MFILSDVSRDQHGDCWAQKVDLSHSPRPEASLTFLFRNSNFQHTGKGPTEWVLLTRTLIYSIHNKDALYIFSVKWFNQNWKIFLSTMELPRVRRKYVLGRQGFFYGKNSSRNAEEAKKVENIYKIMLSIYKWLKTYLYTWDISGSNGAVM